MSTEPTGHPKLTAVLFDLDGTLIDSRPLYMEAYRRAVEPYVREDLTDDDILAMKPTSELAFIRAIVAEDHFDACLENFYRVYRELHVDRFKGVFPGIPAVLESVRSFGLPVGLVTGKSRRSWEITRESTADLGDFDAAIFDDDVRAPKPDPHGLELALEALGVAPSAAVYIGDTRSDMQAAIAAGVRPLAALWAWRPEDRVRHARRVEEVGARVLNRPADILDALSLR